VSKGDSKLFAKLIIWSVALAGCSQQQSNTVTLYRNSPVAIGVRVHWATFNADESDPSFNLNNCLMAARLLNANVTASAKAEGKDRDNSVGFWCEAGSYREHGSIPSTFAEAFPTDV
jgi:hypothetical protein